MECTKENCLLCRNIMDEWREIVKQKRSVIEFKKGDIVFKQGDHVEGIYFILTGKVKVHMTWGDKEYIARLASDGKILGHRGYGLDHKYPITATVLEETIVCYIPDDLFHTLLRTNNQLATELLWFYADELKLTERRMRHLAHMPVKGRVAEALLLIQDAFGRKKNGMLGYAMSRKDIGAMAGTTYETVIRMLNELVADKAVALHGKDIQILNENVLRKCCEESGGQE